MSETTSSLSIALVGSGGSGVMTAGSLLLEAAAKAGWHGLMTRSSGPQIRGGEAAALIRLAHAPVACHASHFDILLGIDWLNAERFAAEIRLGSTSLLIGDEAASPPDVFSGSGARVFPLPLKQLAGELEGGRPNMIALGFLGTLIGLPPGALARVVKKLLQKKGPDAIEASLAGIELGASRAEPANGAVKFEAPAKKPIELWNISGNEAAGLGAIRGGVRFVAAYPITPATEILEWLAPSLEKVGGVLVQAEDELASVNQLIGASFGGTPSLTATSGPGLALMTESIGLAVASETPIVVIDVMRGGPSTGIPTKSEQSDLNIALYGLPGDAPHLVVAPVSPVPRANPRHNRTPARQCIRCRTFGTKHADDRLPTLRARRKRRVAHGAAGDPGGPIHRRRPRTLTLGDPVEPRRGPFAATRQASRQTRVQRLRRPLGGAGRRRRHRDNHLGLKCRTGPRGAG